MSYYYGRKEKYGRAVHHCDGMRDHVRWLKTEIERERRIENGARRTGNPIPWAEAKRHLESLKSDIWVMERFVEELSERAPSGGNPVATPVSEAVK